MTPVYCAEPPDPQAERVLDTLRTMAKHVEDNEELLFNSSLYKRFRDLLQGMFANKCAYCETTLVAMQKPVIEHFRPKGKVTTEGDVTVCGDDGQPLRGYWWLAYKWGNLLPSCWVCNSTHKKNRFPVVGKHAVGSEGLGEEKPLLYNPLNPQTSPEHHMKIDLETGVFEGIDDIGRTTIRTLQLNRVDLVDERRHVIEDTSNLLAQWLPSVALARSDLEVHAKHVQMIGASELVVGEARGA